MAVPQTSVSLDLSDGATPVEVTGWQVTRELSGNLPGQVRAGTGIAAASGTVTFRMPDSRTPWKGGPVVPGGRCSIDAAEDAGLPLVPAARMTIRSVSAAGAMTGERSAELEDVGISRSIQVPTIINPPSPGLEAAWVIDQAARSMGYYQTPEPVPSAVLAVSAVGSLAPEIGTISAAQPDMAWITSKDGRCYGYLSDAAVYPIFTPASDPGLDFYVALTVPTTTARVYFQMSGGGTVRLVITETFTTFTHNSGADVNSATYNLGADRRIEFRVTIGSTSSSLRVRTGAAAPFASPISAVGAAIPVLSMSGIAAKRFLGLQVATSDDPGLWGAVTATVAATGSILQAVLPGDATTAWGLVQDVAQATMGAAWVEGDGTLVYRNKEAMRGAGPVVGTIDALASIVDIPWSISTDDVADRVEVDYSPPVVLTGDATVTVWEATDVIRINGGSTFTQIITLDGSVDGLAPVFLRDDLSAGPVTQYSRIAANTSADGTGTNATVLYASVTPITPNTVKLTVRRPSGSAVYLVDTSGNPSVTIRASVYAASPDRASSVYSGASENDATNPLTIDCGQWVQDSDTAAMFQDWLAGMVSSPLPTLSQVQVVPNSAVKMGDVWRINDPLYTGLSAKCLVTAVDLAGAPGSLTQTLGVVVLSVSLQDVDDYITGALGVATIADLDAAITAALGASPTIDQVQTWLETGAS